MITIWAVIRWVHLMSAILWVGGQLFIVLVLLPVLRKALSGTEFTLLFAQVGRRFGTFSWAALSLLVVTGYLNAYHRGVDWSRLLDSEYGRTLALKLLFVAIVIVLTLVHALYLGRASTRLAERARDLGAADAVAARERQRLRRISIAISSLNLLLNLIIVLLAAALVA